MKTTFGSAVLSITFITPAESGLSCSSEEKKYAIADLHGDSFLAVRDKIVEDLKAMNEPAVTPKKKGKGKGVGGRHKGSKNKNKATPDTPQAPTLVETPAEAAKAS